LANTAPRIGDGFLIRIFGVTRPRQAGQSFTQLPGDRHDGVVVVSGVSAGRKVDSAMARTYREIAIEQMLETVEEAMSQVIDWWADLPPPMKEAIEQFRTQLGAAIDSVEFVKRALDRQVHETDRGKGPP
jgi:hypothetical protein